MRSRAIIFIGGKELLPTKFSLLLAGCERLHLFSSGESNYRDPEGTCSE